VPFVNVSGIENQIPSIVGLQFSGDLVVDLPGTVSSVNLDVASTDQSLEVQAIDGNGNNVAKSKVQNDKTVHNITLTGNNIIRVLFKYSGKEGLLVKICS